LVNKTDRLTKMSADKLGLLHMRRKTGTSYATQKLNCLTVTALKSAGFCDSGAVHRSRKAHSNSNCFKCWTVGINITEVTKMSLGTMAYFKICVIIIFLLKNCR